MICAICSNNNSPSTTICASCGSALEAQNAAAIPDAVEPYSPSLPSGTRLNNGAFAVGQVLGQGGFGITYKSGDMQLRRYVAIKEFFPHGSQRRGMAVVPSTQTQPAAFETARQGFVREATPLARFNHPAIARVFGVFEENNSAYMVMELLEGQSLQKRLDDKGVLPEKEAVAIIEQVGQALSTVHEANLLHRDIKPDNIVLTDDGRTVLIDFGTAREFAADRTRSMTAMVTHGYAPLEQYGKQAKFGPYTDVYALGATLYHCLTGQLPTSAMDRIAGVELQAPAQVNQYISRGVSDATMKALEVKANDRFQNVDGFVQALNKPIGHNRSNLSAAQAQVPISFGAESETIGPAQSPNADIGICSRCGVRLPPNTTTCRMCLDLWHAPVEDDDYLPPFGGDDVKVGGGISHGAMWARLFLLIMMGLIFLYFQHLSAKKILKQQSTEYSLITNHNISHDVANHEFLS